MPPCTDWITGDDVADCCSVESTSGALFDVVASQSQDLLFELSGRLYVGECERTVRPCRTSCGCGWQVLSRGHLVQWRGSEWWCDSNACGCAPLSRVKLAGYPVRAISEVKIDGDIVDPATYRLDEQRFLIRVRELSTDDVLSWPGCQSMDLPDTQEGTFSVTYTYGADPPEAAINAAAELACELYKACDMSLTCALPTGTTRVTRQGITIERRAFTSWAFQKGKWNTGLSLVDAFLNAYNPAGLQRRPTFMGPGAQHRYARPVGT
jgi:hypothetical protein